MPFDPTPFLDPAVCGVVVFECQQMVIGANGPYPGLIRSVRDGGMLDRLATLLDEARDAGATVCYCTVTGRPGGLGAAKTPMSDRNRAAAQSGGTATAVEVDRSIVPELAPGPKDIIVERSHGMSGFHGTELDTCLREMGVQTVIPTGVSANMGIIGTSIEAVNHGYRLVFASDCIAGDPPEYTEQMMKYSYRNLGYVTTAADIADAWHTYK
jgi:nicotinamidase-related amidase